MPTVTIDPAGCRACALCVDICPTKVLEMDDHGQVARAARPEDCIGCTSCRFLCPSRCLDVTDTKEPRPFYRIEENAALITRFLQRRPAAAVLGEADWDEALRDVTVRLSALGASVTETMGRGQKAVGRKAGQLAAAHLPEMYEGKSVEDVLARMGRRFAHAFDFESSVASGGDEITMRFTGCAVARVVRAQGDEVGSALLCGLFHDYWAGLVGTFTQKSHTVQMLETGAACTMKLQARC
ncbi:MAG TPA: 4Fe-4S dicluster domain-containing protein [Polyangia bacterium]|jgi:NAD-dependent dihydropyrimidine dehydrogenase PreA subunit